MVNAASIQENLFQGIREKLAPEESLSEKIAELLFISHDSAYRRIRGETPLVLEEAKILCESFRISLDQILHATDKSVSFYNVSVDPASYNFDRYLKDICQNIRRLYGQPGAGITYLSKDISLFHNFYYRPLFAFRYFFWMRSMIHDPSFQNKKFTIDILPDETYSLGRELLKLYADIPSIEIWNTECVNSLISQIHYYWEAGYITSKEDLRMIYESLEQTIIHLKHQAEEGSKFLPGEVAATRKTNFQLFQNRIVLGDNTILVNSGSKKTVYLNYELLNYLVTQDENFCESVHKNLNDLLRRSTMLSIANEKQRNIFFNILLRKIPSYNKLEMK